MSDKNENGGDAKSAGKAATKARLWDYFVAQNKEEHFRIRDQERSFYHNRSLNSGDAYVKGSTEFRHKAVLYSVDYGKIFVNFNVILNSGAIIALLTFLGSVIGKGDLRGLFLASFLSAKLETAFWLFVSGLISIGLCTAVSWINWIFVSSSWQDEGELMLWQAGLDPLPDQPSKDHLEWLIPFSFYAAAVLGLLSTLFFAAGCYWVLSAFESINLMRWLR